MAKRSPYTSIELHSALTRDGWNMKGVKAGFRKYTHKERYTIIWLDAKGQMNIEISGVRQKVNTDRWAISHMQRHGITRL